MQSIRLLKRFFVATICLSYLWFAYNVTHDVSISAQYIDFKKKKLNVVATAKSKLLETFVITIE